MNKLNSRTLILFLTGILTTSAFSQLASPAGWEHFPPQNMQIAEDLTGQQRANFPNNGWNTSIALPASKWANPGAFVKSCGGTEANGAIFTFAGNDASFSQTLTSYKFDIGTQTWSTIAPFPTSRHQFSAAVVKNKIYLPGGYSTGFQATSSSYMYDPALNTYTPIANLLTQVGDYAIGTYKDSLIYVIGGYNSSTDLNIVQIYNPITDTWTNGTPKIGTATSGLRAGITGNKIIVVGGYSQPNNSNSNLAYMGTIDPSNPANITWTTIANYPGSFVNRMASGASPNNDGRVYFTSGDPNGAGTAVLSTTYAYNVNTNEWETGPNKLVGVSNVCNFIPFEHNDSLKFAVLGGYNGSSIISNFEILKIGPSTSLKLHNSDTSICDQTNINFNASGANNYLWEPVGLFADPTLASQYVTFGNSTQIKVSSKRVWGCNLADSLQVTVNPNPVIAIDSLTPICYLSSPLPLSATPVGGTFAGIGVNSNIFMPSIAGVGTHTLTYTYTTPEGCSDSKTVQIELFDCLSNEEINILPIQLFPNPFQSTLQINSEKLNLSSIEIINSWGQVVYMSTISNSNQTFELGSFKNGVYFVKLTHNNQTQTIHKVVKN